MHIKTLVCVFVASDLCNYSGFSLFLWILESILSSESGLATELFEKKKYLCVEVQQFLEKNTHSHHSVLINFWMEQFISWKWYRDLIGDMELLLQFMVCVLLFLNRAAL